MSKQLRPLLLMIRRAPPPAAAPASASLCPPWAAGL